jgi:hypothetical protein
MRIGDGLEQDAYLVSVADHTTSVIIDTVQEEDDNEPSKATDQTGLVDIPERSVGV